jgi:hypothetical protein
MASIKDILNQKGTLGELASRHQLASYKENTYYTFTAIYDRASSTTDRNGVLHINVKVTDLRDSNGKPIDDHAWLNNCPRGNAKPGNRVRIRATVGQYVKRGDDKFIGFGLLRIAEMAVIQ